MRKYVFGFGMALLMFEAEAASGQRIALKADRYPNVDSTLVIAVGDTVRLLNVFTVPVAPGLPGELRFDFQYASAIPREDTIARHNQADRAAQLLGAGEGVRMAARLSIGLCDTVACAETRAAPREWYEYALTDGLWRRR